MEKNIRDLLTHSSVSPDFGRVPQTQIYKIVTAYPSMSIRKHYCHAFLATATNSKTYSGQINDYTALHVFTPQQMDSKMFCFPFDDTQAKQDLCLYSSDQENMRKRKPSEL